MKTKSLEKGFILAALICLFSFGAWAQTNSTPIQSIPQDVLNLAGDVGNGPWGVAGIYGHSVTGTGHNVAAVLISYDLVTNVQNTGFSSGLIAGYETLWGSGRKQLDTINGGWQFSETGHPLAWVGSTFLTNVVSTELAYQVVSTPRGGSDIGSITGTAVTVNVAEWSGFHLTVLGAYQNRNGQAGFNGNELLFGLAIKHKF
jgi:hypothetical protein